MASPTVAMRSVRATNALWFGADASGVHAHVEPVASGVMIKAQVTLI